MGDLEAVTAADLLLLRVDRDSEEELSSASSFLLFLLFRTFGCD